jgi:probable HAF family extracellular repeat protein
MQITALMNPTALGNRRARKRRISGYLLLGLLLGGAAWPAGVRYHVKDLGPGVGYGMNNAGQVTGASNGHAFLYRDGQMRDLGALLGSGSSASAINDAGQITGSSKTVTPFSTATGRSLTWAPWAAPPAAVPPSTTPGR